MHIFNINFERMSILLHFYLVSHSEENCIDLHGGKCDNQTCSKVCKANGYVDPVVKCSNPPGKSGQCCCFVKCCGRIELDSKPAMRLWHSNWTAAVARAWGQRPCRPPRVRTPVTAVFWCTVHGNEEKRLPGSKKNACVIWMIDWKMS
jgi:hypothetical protein